MRQSLFPFLALLALPVGPLGCNPMDPGPSVGMHDSFEIDLFGPAREDLHTPYVAGASFTITLDTTDHPSTTGWSMKSSDPTVLRVNPSASPAFNVTAMGPGHATLTVLDASGNQVDEHDIDVDEPDTVELSSHGLMLGGMSDTQAQITSANVVQGGAATFLVRYYKGSQELYGNGAVTPTATGAVTATTRKSSFSDARDWIEIDGTQQAGPGQVSLAVGNIVTTIPALVVPASGVASVGTLAQSTDGAKDGDTLSVFARAFDAQGNDVYGASFSWVAGGVPATAQLSVSTPTDMLTYTYKGGTSETLTVALDGFSSSTSVHGSGGTVGSSTATGCSIARAPGAGSTGGGVLAFVLGAAGVLAARRRRGSAA